LLPVDADEDRVQRPRIARARASAAQFVGVGLTERAALLAHRLIGDDDAARGTQLRHVAVAAREAAVPPDRVRDDRGRAPLAVVVGGDRARIHAPSIARPVDRSFLDNTTLRDSLSILNGLLEQQTILRPVELLADTAGYSDIVFGLFWLLGYQFSPRLADLGDARFWRLDPAGDYGGYCQGNGNPALGPSCAILGP